MDNIPQVSFVLGFAMMVCGLQFQRARSRLMEGSPTMSGELEARLSKERWVLFLGGIFVFVGAALSALVGDRLVNSVLAAVGLTVCLIGCVTFAELEVRRGKKPVAFLGICAKWVAWLGSLFIAIGMGFRVLSAVGGVVGVAGAGVLVIAIVVLVWWSIRK